MLLFDDFHKAQNGLTLTSDQKEWNGRVQEFKEKKWFTAEEARRFVLDISASASSGDYT